MMQPPPLASLSLHRSPRLLAGLASLLATATMNAQTPDHKPIPAPMSSYSRGVVVADHPLASEAGAEMLRKGGNVVDAAVATSFALSVLRPEGCGIGGGGFMVIWKADRQEAVALDYRERAPAAATREMYFPQQNAPQGAAPLSETGGLAVGIPGNVAGLLSALEHHGTLDRKTVLAPAIKLAREGVPPDAWMRVSQRAVLKDFEDHPAYRERFAALWKFYINNGRPWEADDRYHSPLADVLERIAAEGAAAFYKGPVGQAIAAEVQKQGGILTAEDLATAAPVVVRQPLTSNFGEHRIYTMPPSSSGGIALIEMLNLLRSYEATHPDQALDKLGHNSPEYIHLVAEAMKHAFADRAEYLGDADFVDVPVERLTSRDYAETLAAKVDSAQTKPLGEYGRAFAEDDAGTSHFCVLDAAGNAVACTETVNTYFGSYVVEPRFGIVLNNEMDDFAAVPGVPNSFGLIQGERNAVAPGKKPLSSMTPTIVVRDGRAEFVVGASGGPRIINGTFQVLLNMVRFGMPPEQAVAAPRFHHQWFPETLYVEPELLPKVEQPLTAKGHQVGRRSDIAAVQAAMRSPEGLFGGSDPDKGGRPAGW
jgi:gamma-glutamyltranspeptidase/glutathione hydrolase